ncbi:MAG: hypothetical protein HS130_07375 [Deltaproteobacteria bacterium]|nr:hypothetical protein [Deltaproteobacteria bacterium]
MVVKNNQTVRIGALTEQEHEQQTPCLSSATSSWGGSSNRRGTRPRRPTSFHNPAHHAEDSRPDDLRDRKRMEFEMNGPDAGKKGPGPAEGEERTGTDG